jgi:pyruvate kinase
MIKKAQKLTKVKVGVMIDLKGPVIRTCEFREKSSVRITLIDGDLYYR